MRVFHAATVGPQAFSLMQRVGLVFIGFIGAMTVTACSDDAAALSSSSSSSSSSGAATSSGDTRDVGADGGGSNASDTGTSGPSALVPGKSVRTYDVAGKSRSVIVVVPQMATEKRVPLVIALHGNGDTNAKFLTHSKLEALSASLGVVVAAPQGLSQSITIGQRTIQVSWDAYRTTLEGNIDIPLLDEIRSSLVATGSIDTTHVLSYGYSQGGYLSFRYGMDRAAELSCAAVLAAASPLGPTLTSGAARRIPISMQIGTNDGAISQARATRDDLLAKAFPLGYHEIEGAGHVPIPGDSAVPLEDCLAHSL